jgi:hypothetical protein
MPVVWICDFLPPINLWNMPKYITNTTDLVVNDLRSREVMGYNKYNKYLNKTTDEDMLQHLYEELLDAAMYIRTLIEQKRNVYDLF